LSDTPTLTEFLQNTGAELTFFDVGRRVSRIDTGDFLAFERTLAPYPYPMQQRAWFALVQQRADADAPLIWFLRFDLDEQGKLVQATRDYFIHRFVELATDKADADDLGKALDDNPYTFKPREEKLANLHAILQRDLGLPPSQFYRHARDYFGGALGWDQWQFLGYQGIADLAARQQDPELAQCMREAIPQLPEEPLIALCHCLENHALDTTLNAALQTRLDQALENAAAAPLVAALLRGLSRADRDTLNTAIRQVLGHAIASDPEVLAAITGRAWEALRDPQTASAFLRRLSSEPVGQPIFNQCMTDLLRLPGLQQPLLHIVRSPERPETLALAFQRMLEGDKPTDR
jgi:hypothetical protein